MQAFFLQFEKYILYLSHETSKTGIQIGFGNGKYQPENLCQSKRYKSSQIIRISA